MRWTFFDLVIAWTASTAAYARLLAPEEDWMFLTMIVGHCLAWLTGRAAAYLQWRGIRADLIAHVERLRNAVAKL